MPYLLTNNAVVLNFNNLLLCRTFAPVNTGHDL